MQDFCNEQKVVSTFYVPFGEQQTYDALTTIVPSVSGCCKEYSTYEPLPKVFKLFSIVTAKGGTLIYYDHHEDGFESNIEIPTQSTTEVWGDMDPSNGIPPGFAVDSLLPGSVISILESYDLPYLGSTSDYNSGDKFAVTNIISSTISTWLDGSKTLFAGATVLNPELTLGTKFQFPVGEDANVNNMFEYTGAFISSYADNNTIELDLDQDGVSDSTYVLQMGETLLINGGLLRGSILTSEKDINVTLLTGDKCANFESRWFTLYPVDKASNRYINAVGTPTEEISSTIDDAPTFVHLYNPNSFDITVNWETSGMVAQPEVSISSYSGDYVEVPNMTASRFMSDDMFLALATIDSDEETAEACDGAENLVNDWGYNLLPESKLRNAIVGVPFAPGSDPTLTGYNENSAPVWITAIYPEAYPSNSSITLCIDYNGDGGDLTDFQGNKYDEHKEINELDLLRLYDADGDQTSMSIWVCDGSKALLSGAWGQDPNTASRAEPAMDMGTAILSLSGVQVKKYAGMVHDDNLDGKFGFSDTMQYCMCVENIGKLDYEKYELNIKDAIPSNLNYVVNSAFVEIDGVSTSLPDETDPNKTPNPLDEEGWYFPNKLSSGATFIACFETVLSNLPEGTNEVCNTAIVTDAAGTLRNEECVIVGCEIMIDEIEISPCNNSASELSLEIDWFENESETLVIKVGANEFVYDVDDISKPFLPTLEIPLDGMDNSIEVSFLNTTCTQSIEGLVWPNLCSPEFSMTKELTSIDYVSVHNYKVTYEISVMNSGDVSDDYDLWDTPIFENDIDILSASWSSTNGKNGTLDKDALKWDLASDEVLQNGSAHVYTLVVDVVIDLENNEGDNDYIKCGENTTDPSPNDGLYNIAYLDIDNDGTADFEDETCGDLPYLLLTKEVKSFTQLSDNTFDVVFEIKVENIGGAQGQYDLNDMPTYEDDVVINSVAYTSNTTWSGTLSETAFPWLLANDQSINAGDSHSFEIAANVFLSLTDNSLGDNVYNACGSNPTGLPQPGEGLYNIAQLDENNDGEIDLNDPVCLDLLVFDLAIRKSFMSTTTPDLGDIVTFDITVFNQGNIDAANVKIVDYLPCGFEFVQTLNPSWTLSGSYANTQLSGIVEAGTGATTSINLRMISCAGSEAYTNAVEISSATDVNNVVVEDTDSTPDSNPDNETGVMNDAILDGDDEDDHDIEKLERCDLALKKEIVSSAPYAFGQVLEFKISIYNQGTTSAKEIEVIDYLPCGYKFIPSLNSDWDLDGSNLVSIIEDELTAGSSTEVILFLELQECDANNAYLNAAEIASSKTMSGELKMDADSNPDKNNVNDLDVINNAVDNPLDEDDHDIEEIEIYDLAIRKLIDAGQPSIGGNISFTIEIHNQGNQAVKNIEVTDFIPCGFKFNATDNPGWTLNGNQAVYLYGGTIMPQEFKEISLLLELVSCGGSESYTNVVEISKAQDVDGNPVEDVDGVFDNDPSNDLVLDDKLLDENDEDNHDVARLILSDLALQKTYTSVGNLAYGSIVDFEIKVINQGNTDVNYYEVSDYIPCGLAFDAGLNPNWEFDQNIATAKINSTLAAGDFTTLTIRLTLQYCGDSNAYRNEAEISKTSDDLGNAILDVDSNPDNIIGNDLVIDNLVDSSSEEDDHDFEELEIYDLAILKRINGSVSLENGEKVEFELEIHNQGNRDVQNVEVSDFIPCGLIFNASDNPDWNLSNDIATYTISETIEAGTFETVTITLELGNCVDLNAYTNTVEISSAEDLGGNKVYDIDSNSDANPTNDNLLDDALLDPNDEDDHDVAKIIIGDFALRKTIASTGNYSYGSPITFKLELVNQGAIAANEITIADYIPCGFTFDDSINNGWTLDQEVASYTYDEELLPGASVEIEINLILNYCSDSDAYLNMAEIQEVKDIDGVIISDFDSKADGVKDNDSLIDDALIEPMDEDDHDVALLEVFDLALRKVAGTNVGGKVNDLIEFNIEITNQGNIPASNIKVVDYLPCGFGYAQADNSIPWTYVNGIADYSYSDILLPGQTIQLPIFVRLLECSDKDGHLNVVEIKDVTNVNGVFVQDIDSSPDNDPFNDDILDNELVDPLDEDDHDVEGIAIYDLALVKTKTSDTPVLLDEIVEFEIEVTNQGNEDVFNVVVLEHFPQGFILDPNDQNGWNQNVDGTYQKIIPSLAAGDVETIFINLKVTESIDKDNLINYAEIERMHDQTGNVLIDIDSEGDWEPDNDLVIDNARGGVGDEDDHDIENVGIFDLALRKSINGGDTYWYGEVIEYKIDVFNQGTIDAENVIIVDYLPSQLFFDPALNLDWKYNGSQVEYSLPYLAEGDDTTIALFLSVRNDAEGYEIINNAEIGTGSDQRGNADMDFDSRLDFSFGNDNKVIDDEINSKDDEDDHDLARAILVDCQELVCIGDVNLSLDDNCTSVITPAMLLYEVPNDPALYEIIIKDENGDVVDNMFNHTEIGKCFDVSVGLPDCGGNSCWSKVCIEDKFAPQIDCGPVQEVFACSAPSADLTAVVPPTITSDNCDGAELMLVSEVITPNDDCDPTDLLATIVRCYKAVDVSGNESAVCCQTIEVKRIVTGAIVWPAPFSSTDCTISTGTGVTGVPMIGGVPIYPSVPNSICNLMVSFEDIAIQEDGCHNQFLRMWSVSEWWCGGLVGPTTHGQLIEVRDVTPPTITCPADMTVQTGTSYGDCESTFMLPAATVNDECNNPVEVDIITGVGFIDNSNGGEATLTVGTHTITYVAYDGCYNSSTCTMEVTVVDGNQPTILCDEFTVVTLTNTGLALVDAEVFDDGSFDDCGVDRFEVRRMTDPCGIAGNTDFGDSVTFCCADVGTEVMVVLRVYDTSGNFNECMTMVEVQDKSVADIMCIPNQTIYCPAVYDVANLAPLFGMPTIIGATCTDVFPITEATPVVDVNNCGLGTITRNFSAPNGQGGTLTCTQVITIENNAPFDGDDPAQLQWPLDFSTTSMCDFTDATPDNLPTINSYPIVTEDACDLVGWDYEDQEFTFASDPTACFKILRTWTVIDWCQRRADGTFEEWTHVQEIKILNDTDPVISSGLVNQVVESLDINCSSEFVTLGITATDDCPSNAPLNYSYEIDLGSNGVINQTGTTNNASGTYPIGVHTIYWLVLDGCGNDVQGSHTFEVRNIKPPVAICLQGLSIDLTMMDTDGDNIPDANMAILWASDFDKGSYHPCGYPVTLSFSSDVTDTNITFDCDDLGQQSVQLWVTDPNGNQSFCSTFIIVQDNDSDCPSLPGRVSGRIFTETDDNVSDVEVSLIGSGADDMTEVSGEYNFLDMPMGGSYTVAPSKNDDVKNGISTLDLVLIQKHLLKIKELDSPYKRIAADINHDDRISSVDLLQLRKLILGIYEEFPSNESWRFVDALHVFPDVEDPWFTTFPEDYDISLLDMSMWIDFVGVKVGDVNDSATANATGSVVEKRSFNPLVLKYNNREAVQGDEIVVEITSDNFKAIAGMQFTLEHQGLTLNAIEGVGIDVSNINIGQLSNNVTTFSWFDSNGNELSRSNEVLFNLIFEVQKNSQLADMLSIVDGITPAEAYKGEGLEVVDVILENGGEELIDYNEAILTLGQNEPNPWSNQTSVTIESSEVGKGEFKIVDISGRVMLLKQIELNNGINNISVTNDEIPVSGVYTYTVTLDNKVISKKMIKI